MASFSFKKISNPLSLGEMLKEEREKKKISLLEASKKIKISIKYLEALESAQLDCLPGEVYAKNFLKVYSEFLGFDSKEIVSLYCSEKKIYSKTKKIKENKFNKPVEKISFAHLISGPKIFKGIIVLILALVCVAYLGFKVNAIMEPPKLIVEMPINDLSVDNNLIEVKGFVEKEVILEINNQQVLVNPKGYFSEMINLQPGVNVIEIKAVKRHGRETKVYRRVVLNEKN